jgi:hypothetical protein
MASFTDTQIQPFNPYVQQLPVDAMVKVGMAKQQQYDQGVQKIQGYIDNIAGMDVSRDVDKEHLKSKLNELGGKLRTVASGDFSNQQLVNSVGGMATQIVKDPFVQAAVYSTANDREQNKQMEADEKAGKLTPQARYYYDLKRNAYLSNPNLKDQSGKPIKFSGQYTPSWDIEKNLIEAVKAVGDSKYEAQQVFKTDPAGKILYDKAGAPILSEYAVEEIKQGKFSEKIAAAIDTVLSRPEAKQEMAMRGVYNYRGYNKLDDFVRQYEEEKNKGVSILESKRLDLLSKGASETDPEKKKLIQSLIDKTDNDISTLKQYGDEKIQRARQVGDLDTWKSLVYEQGLKNKFTEAYTTETISRKYVESAPWKAERQRIKDERDWWADQQNIKQGWSRIDISKQQLALDKEKWKNDPNNPDKPLTPGSDYLTKSLNDVEVFSNWIEKGQKIEESAKKTKDQFVFNYVKAINFANGKSVSDEDIRKNITEWEKNAPGYIDRTYDRAKDDIQKNPKNPYYTPLLTQLPVAEANQRALSDYSNEVKDLNKHPDVLSAGSGENLDFTKLGKGLPSFNISLSEDDVLLGGTRMPFQEKKHFNFQITPKDILNASLVYNNDFLKNQEYSAFAKQAKEELEKKFGSQAYRIPGLIGSPVVRLYAKDAGVSEEGIERIFNTSKLITSSVGQNVLSAKAKVLKQKMLGNEPLVVSLYPEDAKEPQIKSVNQRLNEVIDNYKGTIDVDKFTNFLAGKDRDKYNVSIGVDRGTPGSYGETFTLDLYDGNTLVQQLPIDKRSANYIKGAVINLPAPVSDVNRKIAWSENNRTTNSITGDPNNPVAYTGAYYPPSFFHQRQETDILGADIKVNDLGQHNIYFYIKDGEGNVRGIADKNPGDIYPVAYPSADAAQSFINSLTPGRLQTIKTLSGLNFKK